MVEQSLPILFFSDDKLLANGLSKIFCKKFGLQLILINPKDYRKSKEVQQPKIILLDARIQLFIDIHELQWLKDHFHGVPIISFNSPGDEKTMQSLSRLGINQHVELNTSHWYQQLSLFVYAVLLDDEPEISFNEFNNNNLINSGRINNVRK